MMMRDFKMKCVDWDETRKVKFENPPPGKDGSPRKVIWITRRQKCSDFNDNLRLKEGEREDSEDAMRSEEYEDTEEMIVIEDEEAEAEPDANNDDLPNEVIREHFKRFLQGIV